MRTREHHFRQEWCRGNKSWTAESLCLDCHCFSWRSYTCAPRALPCVPRQAPNGVAASRRDPEFLSPEDFEKLMWAKLVPQNEEFQRNRRAAIAV